MRINCINVKHLSDQHLRAEWVEMLMLPPYINRSIASKQGLVLSNSNEYTLNTGHARFFYDKLEYVCQRYISIGSEMNDRGYMTNPSLNLFEFDSSLFNDWIPTDKDKYMNLDRIITRISEKPEWYSYNGARMTLEEWIKFYELLYPGYKYQKKSSDLKNKTIDLL